MRPTPTFRSVCPVVRASAGLVLLAASGCATLGPGTAPTSPPVQLLTAGPLELPSGCEPAHGAVYRTNFVVQADGSVRGAHSESGEGCVQQALQDWVSSFRYRPGDAAVPVVIDWMPVTGRRGG